ncbi:MAG: TIM barrel protein [Bryobacteraceae bacterium]
MLRPISRRRFVTSTAAAAASVLSMKASPDYPFVLPLSSVQQELKRNESDTLNRLAEIGYRRVELDSSYLGWSVAEAKEYHKRLADNGLRCISTTNPREVFESAQIDRAVELNCWLDSLFVVMSEPGNVTTSDDWKRLTDVLNHAAHTANHARFGGIQVDYRSHEIEWKLVDGVLPMQFMVDNLHEWSSIQFDVGACLKSGYDPVPWIISKSGAYRIPYLHDWSREKDYDVIFGEGTVPWPKFFSAFEKHGVVYYVLEPGNSDLPELDAAKAAFDNYQRLRA